MRASKTALLALFSILRSQLYDDQFGRLKQLLAVRFESFSLRTLIQELENQTLKTGTNLRCAGTQQIDNLTCSSISVPTQLPSSALCYPAFLCF